jgi:hypothetical protein
MPPPFALTRRPFAIPVRRKAKRLFYIYYKECVMKRVIALLTLLLLLLMVVGGDLGAMPDPYDDGRIGGGDGEDEPDGEDHPWGEDQIAGGDEDLARIKVQRPLSTTLTGIWSVDYFINVYFIWHQQTCSPTPVYLTNYRKGMRRK